MHGYGCGFRADGTVQEHFSLMDFLLSFSIFAIPHTVIWLLILKTIGRITKEVFWCRCPNKWFHCSASLSKQQAQNCVLCLWVVERGGCSEKKLCLKGACVWWHRVGWYNPMATAKEYKPFRISM